MHFDVGLMPDSVKYVCVLNTDNPTLESVVHRFSPPLALDAALLLDVFRQVFPGPLSSPFK